MTYQQTVDYLYAQLPMFSRIGTAAYKEDLHNTIALCEALGNPHTKFKSIHIAGTNGKGSTSHMLAAILQQAGYKTGLYTSPHLHDFRERIKLNGQMISETFVVDFAERIRKTADALQPSFFEITVAMAFDYFAQEGTDIVVVETGLGGRLDSTNIITPLLSVITNIGYDHMNILGDTLEKIAFEKAGIIKPGVPVIIGEWLNETKPVFLERAAQTSSAIHFAQDEFVVSNVNITSRQLECDVTGAGHSTTEHFILDLNGIYQTKNLSTVLSAEALLMQMGFNISDEAEKLALANTKKLTGLFGRWDVIAAHPAIVLDVAHNEDGIRQLFIQLSLIKNQFDRLHIITGMVREKEIDKVLSLMPAGAEYYFTNAHIPRALPASELQSKAKAHGLEGNVFDNVNDAIKSARQRAGINDLLLVCGSVFVVGEVACDARN